MEYTESVARYFAQARERHAIYHRRQAGLPRPWTTDPTMMKYRFTNVFRELDRTTTWFRENVRNHYADSPAAILATLVFRIFNRVDTGISIFGQGDFFDSSPFNVFCEANIRGSNDPHTAVLDLKKAILAGMKPGGPYVTGSYIIKTPAGMTKLDGVLWIIAEALRGEMKVRPGESSGRVNLYDWGEHLLRAQEAGEPECLETVTAWLERLPYIGWFTAFEIVSDLRWTRLLDKAPDIMTWANPGPGCRRGMKRVVGGAKNAYIGNDAELLEMMRWMLAESRNPRSWPQPVAGQPGKFVTDGYEMPEYGRDPVEGDWPAWEMREVEHFACEHDKYIRAINGEGRPRGTI